jgi:serine/threonine-protein kinase
MLSQNRLDDAVRLLTQAGLCEEAAEALDRAGRFREARELRAGGASTGPGSAARRDAAPARPGAPEARPAEAIEPAPVSRRSIAPTDARAAAEQAERQGRLGVAAGLYERAGSFEDAARCFHASGDRENALRTVVLLPREARAYADACALAIALACDLDRVDFGMDQFVGPFLARPPQGEKAVEAFYRLADLYERHGYQASARDAFRAITKASPRYRDATLRLAAIEARLAEEGNDRLDDARGSLPDLPDLPDLPPLSVRGGSLPPVSPSPGERRAPPPPPPSRGQPPPVPRRPPPPPPPRAAHSSPAPPSVRGGAPRSSRFEEEGPASGPSSGPRDLPPIHDVTALRPGFMIAERYEVRERLGIGGTATVYRARDREIDEDIGIKVFAHGAQDATLVQRFKRELQVCRQITHPNVIRLFDIGQHGHTKFLTMELLSGTDLATRVEQASEWRRVDYLMQLCEGLERVHALGVVHRDLKPENVFVTIDEVVKLMDFGIAKRIDARQGITHQGLTAGTPAFMAPEQIQAFGSVTHLSDIYSLGVIAYLLFTGVLPFDSEDTRDLLNKHIRETPLPPSFHHPDIDRELEEIILRLLEKDPAARVQSCRELAALLESVRDRCRASTIP